MTGRRWAGCVVLAMLLWAGTVAGQTASQGSLMAGFELPFDFAPVPRLGVAVLEDRAGRVLLIRPQGRTRELSGLTRPLALAVDETGLLIVLEGRPGEQALAMASFRGEEPIWRVALSADPVPEAPVSLAARDGVVWIVDRSPPRIFVYAYDGERLGITQLTGIARSPFAVALGPTGEAFVTDPMGPTVLALNAAGVYVGQLSLEGTGVTRPTGLAVSPDGRVWVSDGVMGSVTCLDPDGKSRGLRCEGAALRLEDPLRLGWADGSLWTLEARPGRVRRVERAEP